MKTLTLLIGNIVAYIIYYCLYLSAGESAGFYFFVAGWLGAMIVPSSLERYTRRIEACENKLIYWIASPKVKSAQPKPATAVAVRELSFYGKKYPAGTIMTKVEGQPRKEMLDYMNSGATANWGQRILVRGGDVFSVAEHVFMLGPGEFTLQGKQTLSTTLYNCLRRIPSLRLQTH